MLFLPDEKSAAFAESLGLTQEKLSSMGDRGQRSGTIRLYYENDLRPPIVLAKAIVRWLGEFSSCLLWVTEWGMWMENLQLYYQLRRSYGNGEDLLTSPGHVFFSYESTDLTSFLDVALRACWGCYLVSGGQVYVSMSHDGWLRMWFRDDIGEQRKGAILEDIEENAFLFESD